MPKFETTAAPPVFNLRTPKSAIVVGNIIKIRESVASLFEDPIQIDDDHKDPQIDWSLVRAVILIDRICPGPLKARWEEAARGAGVPVIGGYTKSGVRQRLDQRFKVIDEELVAAVAPKARQALIATPPPEPESRIAAATATGLGGLLEEAQRLVKDKEEAEAMALRQMERADSLAATVESLSDNLAAARVQIQALEELAPDQLEEEVESRLAEAVDAETKELKRQLTGLNSAVQDKDRQIRKLEERNEKAKEEVAKAKAKYDEAVAEGAKSKSNEMKAMGRRGQLMIAMSLFTYLIPMIEEGDDDDLIVEMEKAVSILFQENKIKAGAMHYVKNLESLVKALKNQR